MSARVVLVTGGARRIGAAIVRALAAEGHFVLIHHRSGGEAAEALRAALADAGHRAATVQGDLADPATPPRLMEAARTLAGRPVDGLVNCASLFDFDRPPDVKADLLDQAMRTNLAAPVALAIALARQPDLADGAVVNVLDQKVANLNPDFFSYTLSKAALESATTMLAQALAPRVRVNAVSPGLTMVSHDQTADEFAAVARDNLLKRPVAVEDIAASVSWLLGCGSITGQNLFVDCGQRFVTRDSDVMFATRNRVLG